MALRKLTKYLEENGARYEVVPHSKSFTAQDVAESAHIPGREMAKTVIVSIDGELAMTVMPASMRLDLDRMRMLTGAKDVQIAKEKEFESAFPECELGAMPPFGSLYGMREFVDQKLREDEQIAFNAGTHDEVIRMPYSDFERLTQPIIVSIAH